MNLTIRTLFLLSICIHLAVPLRASGQEGGRKLALLVNISEFGTPSVDPETGEQPRGYKYLPTTEDAVIMARALATHGFRGDDVRILRNEEATAEGMRAGFRWLVREAGPGDDVVFHFSGHGHQIVNDDPATDEEIDGLDEVLVAYGAPSEFYEGYEGAMHIRDDEVGRVIADLRERVGPAGSVTFFIDACYSGTISRGSEWVRGYPTPLGLTSGAPRPRPEAGTGIDVPQAPRTRGSADDLAPYAVFSAASQWQMAYGVALDEGPPVGLMTFALAAAISDAAPGTTHAALLAQISRTVAARKPQDPQLEGVTNAHLFSNRLSRQSAFVEVDSMSADGAGVFLGAGTVLGVNVGTRLLIHPVGATEPDRSTAAASLEVTRALATSSFARFTSGSAETLPNAAWAFVTEPSFGALALRVELDESLSQADVEGLTRVIERIGIVTRVEEAADLLIERDSEGVVARVLPSGRELGRGAQQIVYERLEQFARANYVRRVEFDDEELEVFLDVGPASLDPETGLCVHPDWSAAQASPQHVGGAQWRFGPGEIYALRVRNEGEVRVFLGILSVTDSINVLRPRQNASAEELLTRRQAGRNELTICLRTDEKPGHDVIKVFASRRAQPFRAMFNVRDNNRTRSGLSDLARVLNGSTPQVRSGGGGSTVSRSIHIYVAPTDPGQNGGR